MPRTGILLNVFRFILRSVSLVPYAIFSTFHVLTFVRTTVLPKLAPPKPPAREGERQSKDTPLQKQLHAIVKGEPIRTRLRINSCPRSAI
jgi:hypothetical protein